jgi:hypothetical protein
VQGVLRMGQEIEIRPGIVTKDAEGRAACLPIFSRIVSLLAEQNVLQYAVPGGLIGVGTTVGALHAAPCVQCCGQRGCGHAAFSSDVGGPATAAGRIKTVA